MILICRPKYIEHVRFAIIFAHEIETFQITAARVDHGLIIYPDCYYCFGKTLGKNLYQRNRSFSTFLEVMANLACDYRSDFEVWCKAAFQLHANSRPQKIFVLVYNLSLLIGTEMIGYRVLGICTRCLVYML